MREHDPMPKDENGRVYCRWCGFWMRENYTATCVDRATVAPEPRRRVSAMDDFDTIASRLEELRKERESVHAHEVPVADPMDSMYCG